MNNNPLVSIITPSYNQAPFLKATIQSVLNQDYPDIEYGIVDGASTDFSVDIIKEHEDDIDWWISEPDQGQADAINKGMSRAQGEIVAWVNSDDIYFPGAVSKAVEVFKSSKADMVYGDAITMDKWGKPLNYLRFGDWELPDLMRFNMICQPAVFVRQEVWDALGGLDPTYHYMLDHHLWIRIGAEYTIQHISEILAASRHHQDAKNVAFAADFSKEIFRLTSFMEENQGVADQYREDKDRVLGGAYRLSARYLLDGKQPFKAIVNYVKALWFWPSDAIKYWPRILFSVISLMTGLQIDQVKKRSRINLSTTKGLDDWPGLSLSGKRKEDE